jgi:hypothetical protein
MTNWINIFPLLLVYIGCAWFLITKTTQFLFAGVGIIIVAEFILDIQFVSLSAASIRLIACLASVLVMFISTRRIEDEAYSIRRNTIIFRSIAFVVISIPIVFLSISVAEYLRIPVEIIIGGLLAVVCGILQLGLSTFPSKVIFCIIIIYCGFASIYNLIESSLLVNGLLSVVILLLGGIGTYLIIRDVKEESK